MADPEGVRGVQTNPLLSLNYFIFMGDFRKNWSNCSNRTPSANLNPDSKILDPPLLNILVPDFPVWYRQKPFCKVHKLVKLTADVTDFDPNRKSQDVHLEENSRAVLWCYIAVYLVCIRGKEWDFKSKWQEFQKNNCHSGCFKCNRWIVVRIQLVSDIKLSTWIVFKVYAI